MWNLCSTSVMFSICLDRPVMNQEQGTGTCIGKLNRGSFDFHVYFSSHVSQTTGISSKNSLGEKSLKLCSYLPSRQLEDFNINSSNSSKRNSSTVMLCTLQACHILTHLGLFLGLYEKHLKQCLQNNLCPCKRKYWMKKSYCHCT